MEKLFTSDVCVYFVFNNEKYKINVWSEWFGKESKNKSLFSIYKETENKSKKLCYVATIYKHSFEKNKDVVLNIESLYKYRQKIIDNVRDTIVFMNDSKKYLGNNLYYYYDKERNEYNDYCTYYEKDNKILFDERVCNEENFEIKNAISVLKKRSEQVNTLVNKILCCKQNENIVEDEKINDTYFAPIKRKIRL